MPEATKTPTTTPAPLPSLFDLGRLNREQWRKIGAIDEHRLAVKDDRAAHDAADAAYILATDEAEALEQLVFNRPVATVADATALAVQGYLFAEGASEAPECADVETMQRAFAKIAVALAPAAGIADLDQLGCDGSAAGIRRLAIGEV